MRIIGFLVAFSWRTNSLFSMLKNPALALQNRQENQEWNGNLFFADIPAFSCGCISRPSVCHVSGEGDSDNPDYCTAFAVTFTTPEDCCWTANSQSIIPNHLQGMVTIADNTTMLVSLFCILNLQLLWLF